MLDVRLRLRIRLIVIMITVEFIFVMDHTVKECNDNIIVIFRLHDDKDEPSMPTLASVRLIHNIPELKVCQEV